MNQTPSRLCLTLCRLCVALLTALLISGCGLKTLDVPQASITPSEKNLKNCLDIDGTYEATVGELPYLYLTRALLTTEAEARFQSNRKDGASSAIKKENKEPAHSWVTIKTSDDGESFQLIVFNDQGAVSSVLIESSQMKNELSCTPSYWESARSYNTYIRSKGPRALQEHSRLSKLPDGNLLMDYQMDEWIEESWKVKKREERKGQGNFKKVDLSLSDVQEDNEKMKRAQASYAPTNKNYLQKCTVVAMFSLWGGFHWSYDAKVSPDGKELPPLKSYDDGIRNTAYCRP